MPEPSPFLRVVEAADADGILAIAADEFIACTRNCVPDLAGAVVLLPTLHAGSEFRDTLASRLSFPTLILPRVTTYADLGLIPDADDESVRRAVWIYGALRTRNWFDDASRWGISRELCTLFDELSANNISLPADIAAFAGQLQAAYRSGISKSIDFEARLVSDLWFALERDGSGTAARRKSKLAALAEHAAGPLVAVVDDAPNAEQTGFFSAWATRWPTVLVRFSPERADICTRSGFLGVVWPGLAEGVQPAAGRSLIERASRLHREVTESPLKNRVSLLATGSCEQEARAAALSVRAWLAEGARTIAVVTQDRLVARRLRALLERDRMVVRDEAGWKLSTTSAATVVARWLDTVAEGFYHRDVLDLLKSPFALFDLPADSRRALVHLLEKIIRRENVIESLDAIASAVRLDHGRETLSPLIERLESARDAQLGRGRDRKKGVPLGAWLSRLDSALQVLGITAGLARDDAGRQLLDLLRRRSEALADDRQPFLLHEWRAWLNGEFEAATFRDTTIESPVTFTQLASVRLRRFDRVLLLGADSRHLPARPATGRFFNQRVRGALGLPTAERALENQRRDLISLFALSGSVRVTWQGQRGSEPNPPAGVIDQLRAVHQYAYDDGLQAIDLESWIRADAAAQPADRASPAGPRPSAPDLVPQRMSASAFASLVDCPYQFYARHMLRLNVTDEVLEQVEKSDFGEAVHRILKGFHERVPVAGGETEAACLALLEELAGREFAPLVARNPLAAGFRAEWRMMTKAYLAWQLEREAAGWRFEAAEVKRERALELGDGSTVTLSGRLDRIDRNAGGALAVLDYKARRADALRREAAEPGEDVQLASYALLCDAAAKGGETRIAQAAYIALERTGITLVSHQGDPAESAARAAQRLEAMLTAVRGGAGLPAHGAAGVCGYCEMRGLCRRDFWERT